VLPAARGIMCGPSAGNDDQACSEDSVVLLAQIISRFKQGQVAIASPLATTSVYPGTSIDHQPFPPTPGAPTLSCCNGPPPPPSPFACLATCCTTHNCQQLQVMPTKPTTAAATCRPSAGMLLQHRPQQVHPSAREVLHLARALVHCERRLQPRAQAQYSTAATGVLSMAALCQAGNVQTCCGCVAQRWGAAAAPQQLQPACTHCMTPADRRLLRTHTHTHSTLCSNSPRQ
jgi:hypothetical protein